MIKKKPGETARINIIKPIELLGLIRLTKLYYVREIVSIIKIKNRGTGFKNIVGNAILEWSKNWMAR